MRRVSRAAALIAMISLACACGSASGSPAASKPTIVLGDQGTSEQLLLGEIYAQAFRASGYVVILEPNIGDTAQVEAAFLAGRIDAYPGDADQPAPDKATAMEPASPFSDTAAAITLASFAEQRHLTSIDQLRQLPFRLKFGDQTGGDDGLGQAYGLTNLTFVPLAAGTSVYDALDAHLVQVGAGLLTDPQLTAATYVALTDPKGAFHFHHTTLIIRPALLSGLGPGFQQVFASVTNLLTRSAMQSLNRAVEIDGQLPALAAHNFLVAKGVVGA